MNAISEDSSASRRTVLKSGALGMGALATTLGVAGLTPASADAAIPAPPTPGTLTFLLKIPGIDGSSTLKGHERDIPILSFDFGVTNPSSSGGGSGSGKVTPLPFAFTARTSVASPALFLAVATGKHLPSAVLTVLRPGETPTAVITLSFNELILTGYELANDPSGGAPLDQISLTYARISYGYATQDPKGGIARSVTETWNFVANRR